MAFWRRLKRSQVAECFRILSEKDRHKILVVSMLQVASGVLDLVGVGLVGVLGALAVEGVSSHSPGSRITAILNLFGIEHRSFQFQVAFLGISATFVFLLRTISSIFINWRILRFLGNRSASLSADLVSSLLRLPILKLQERTAQESLYGVTSGVVLIVLGVLGSVASMVADVSLLLILAVGIFIVSPLTALMTAILFGAIGLTLYYLMNVKAREYGLSIARLDILSSTKVLEVLNSYRESVVRNRRDYYAQQIRDIRFELSGSLARMQFLPNVSKYVIEAAVVLGSILISAIQFLFLDSSHAVATLSIFLAAGSRIAPAVLRAQQSAVNIKSNLAASGPTLSIMRELGAKELSQSPIRSLELIHPGFVPVANLKAVTFRYPGATSDAISQISFVVEKGTSLAVVGPSGAGKTTLIDLMLGILEPDSGEIEISAKSPKSVVESWPGAIAYVPQDVRLVTGTIRENISLGFPASSADSEHYDRCLQLAQLSDFVDALPNGIDTEIGENGAKISGGQKQRLGIARAMFTNPEFLVLDEATSALDAETENDLSKALAALKGEVTLILVAHRLSTIRDAGQVIYLEAGRSLAIGSFDEVRNAVPKFDQQARLMGLA